MTLITSLIQRCLEWWCKPWWQITQLEYIAVILLLSPHQITIRDNIEQVPRELIELESEIISGGAWCGGAIMMFHFALAGKINSIYAAKISATILRKWNMCFCSDGRHFLVELVWTWRWYAGDIWNNLVYKVEHLGDGTIGIM